MSRDNGGVTSRVASALRIAVIVVGLGETLAVLAFSALMLQSSDPLGRAIGQGMVKLIAIPFCVLVLPGLALGLANRWLPAGLALVALAVPVTLIVWRLA